MSRICNGSLHRVLVKSRREGNPHPGYLFHLVTPGLRRQVPFSLGQDRPTEILMLQDRESRLLLPTMTRQLKPSPFDLLLCHLALAPQALPSKHPHIVVP